jgi:hypothetical protein
VLEIFKWPLVGQVLGEPPPPKSRAPVRQADRRRRREPRSVLPWFRSAAASGAYRSRDRIEDRSHDRFADRSRDRFADRFRDRFADRFRDRLADRSHDRFADRSRDRLADRSRDRFMERFHDRLSTAKEWQDGVCQQTGAAPPRNDATQPPRVARTFS